MNFFCSARSFERFLILSHVVISGDMSGAKGDEALAEYNKAVAAVAAKKAAPRRAASTEVDNEVQFLRSSKRKAASGQAPSSSKKKSKMSEATPKESPLSPFDLKNVLANLTTKVLPSTPVLLVSEENSCSRLF